MKNIFTSVIICLSLVVLGQENRTIAEKIHSLSIQNENFPKFDVLEESTQKSSAIESIVTNATLAELDLATIHSIYAKKSNTLEISIPYQGQTLEVQLYSVDPFTEEFTVKTNKEENVNYTPGVYYRGIIKNDPKSLVSFNFFENEFSGIISSPEFQNLNIGRLQSENNLTTYIVYSDMNLKKQPNVNCETIDTDNGAEKIMPPSLYFEKAEMAEHCITMYYELDYDLFTANGSDLESTMNWFSAAFNNMQTLYENDAITVALNEVFIWETLDPYQGTGYYPQDYLAAFHSLRPDFNGDVGQLIGIDGIGGGVAAAIDGLCTENNYSYANVDFEYETIPIYSWTIMVMTHENGHVLGSRHTHACVWNGDNTAIDGCSGFVEGDCALPGIPPQGGTMMSYCHMANGINFSLGFGEQPKTVIINTINSQECLSSDCINTCYDTINNFEFTEVTESSVNLTWEDSDENADLWEFAVREFGSDEPLNWEQVSVKNVEIHQLEPNTFYVGFVRKICGDIAAGDRKIFMTTGDFCGNLFTDTGGENGDYSDNEDYVRTFFPLTENGRIKVTINEFLTYAGDYLYVFDGSDTSAPDLTDGGLSGVDLGLVYESTHASGALTVRFVSDNFTTAKGWDADVECLDDLATAENEKYIDFIYYPNPVLDILNISAKFIISEASVYDISGKILSTKTIGAKDAKLDFSSFPKGSYVVELKFENKPVSFKIIKK